MHGFVITFPACLVNKGNAESFSSWHGVDVQSQDSEQAALLQQQQQQQQQQQFRTANVFKAPSWAYIACQTACWLDGRNEASVSGM